MNSAWLYVMELFGWRELRNRREVGAIVGLTPMPNDSGQQEWERGMSKVGNRHVRAMAIEIASLVCAARWSRRVSTRHPPLLGVARPRQATGFSRPFQRETPRCRLQSRRPRGLTARPT